MNRVWNEVERQFIRDNAGVLTDEVGAKQLTEISGREITVHAWRKQRQKLGLKKSPGRGVCALVNITTCQQGNKGNDNKSNGVPF
jgi:hypothetical protein